MEHRTERGFVYCVPLGVDVGAYRAGHGVGGWIVAHCVFCLIVIPAKRGVTGREMGA